MREIRLMSGEDLPNIIKLVNEIFDQSIFDLVTEQQKQRHETYMQENNLRLGLEQGALAIFGYLADGALCAAGAIQKDGLITMLYVIPEYQRQGIGAAILSRMSAFAAEMWNVKTINVYAVPVKTASYFYRMGFQRFAEELEEFDAVHLYSSLPKPFHNRYQEKKISQKTLLLVTAIVLLTSFLLVAGATVYHMAAEEPYTMQDFYSSFQ